MATDIDFVSLERYGFPEGDEPRPVRCDSGYWTPWYVATEELKRLRAERERDDVAFELLVKEASLLRAERDALQSRLDEVREIYAGMDGFIPQTAPEGYLLRIVKQMYDAAMTEKRGT